MATPGGGNAGRQRLSAHTLGSALCLSLCTSFRLPSCSPSCFFLALPPLCCVCVSVGKHRGVRNGMGTPGDGTEASHLGWFACLLDRRFARTAFLACLHKRGQTMAWHIHTTRHGRAGRLTAAMRTPRLACPRPQIGDRLPRAGQSRPRDPRPGNASWVVWVPSRPVVRPNRRPRMPAQALASRR